MAEEERQVPEEEQERQDEQQKDEEDIYKEEDVEQELENDEISEGEAGFMAGYDREKSEKKEDEDKD